MFGGFDSRAFAVGVALACALTAHGAAQLDTPAPAPTTPADAPAAPAPAPVPVPAPAPAPTEAEPDADGDVSEGGEGGEDADEVEAVEEDLDSESDGDDDAAAEPEADDGALDSFDDDLALELDADEPLADEGAFHLGEGTLELTPEDVFHASGSVAAIGEPELARLGYSDPTNVVQRVPGVVVRVEDGFGLRPNIGIRGTNPERSRGITLMEDGVLFGPAPYSAPAAYYFPLVTRMTGVEVYKGPAAILYGPHTIGGAINFLSREVPTTPSGEIRLSYGSYGNRTTHAHYGMSAARTGFLIEVVDLGSRGFKHIDGSSDDTGFSRTEVLARAFVQSRTSRPVFHRLGLKLTYSRERSNETYLGLSDADYRADPDRRYVASDGNVMRWQRYGYELEHRLEAPHDITLTTTLYRHDLTRQWHRFDRFGAGGPAIMDVLASPDSATNSVYMAYLRGDENTEPGLAQTNIIAVNNDRRFVSQGVQSTLTYDREHGRLRHQLRAGVRLHYDHIVRIHTSESYDIVNRQLVRNTTPEELDRDERASTLAGALFAAYSLEVGRLRISPGLRTELIRGTLADYLDTDPSETSFQHVVLGGLGANVRIIDPLSVFVGVHRGFSPVAPGSGNAADPELSTNFELGARFRDDELGIHAELAGFVNDYSNMLLTCGGSGGCAAENVDKQFNAGAAIVAGIETSVGGAVDLPLGMTLPFAATYSFLRSTFRSDFTSGDPQYADVEAGDEVPYLPHHQATLGAGLEHARFRVNATGTFVSAMREQAGHGSAGFFTDRQAFLDLSGEVRLHERIHLTMRVENVTNARPIVAHRPYGARPYRPLMAQLGLRVEL